MTPLVDVIIPTQFDPARKWTLIHQVRSALNQGVDARVVIIASEENLTRGRENLEYHLTDFEKRRVDYFVHPDGVQGNPFDEPRGYMCNPAILAYMESDQVAAWQLQTCDDDCLTPWALRYLIENSEGVSMVIGRSLAVDRQYQDRRQYRLNETTDRCHVGLAGTIIKTEDVKKLPRPWLNPHSGYGDWQLIDAMARAFPHRFIAQIVNIQSLTL